MISTDPEGVCNAYGRDRGEDGVASRVDPDLWTLSSRVGSQGMDEEFLYVFRQGQWWWSGVPVERPESFKPLTLEDCK